MARHSRLFKRAGKWTFRVRVPADIQGKIGKKEIWKALGDVPHAEARGLARVESVKADALFAEAIDRLGECVVIAVTDAADGGLDAGLVRTAMIIDERDHVFDRRSSSAMAK